MSNEKILVSNYQFKEEFDPYIFYDPKLEDEYSKKICILDRYLNHFPTTYRENLEFSHILADNITKPYI
jgi:hypothetical protein